VAKARCASIVHAFALIKNIRLGKKKLARYEHVSLFPLFVSGEEKRFITLKPGPEANVIKHNTTLNYEFL